MTPKLKKNLLKLPVILLVRVPVVGTLGLLCWIGDLARDFYDNYGYCLPGWDE